MDGSYCLEIIKQVFSPQQKRTCNQVLLFPVYCLVLWSCDWNQGLIIDFKAWVYCLAELFIFKMEGICLLYFFVCIHLFGSRILVSIFIKIIVVQIYTQLFHLFEKLLGMAADLLIWSSRNKFREFLPVFAKNLYAYTSKFWGVGPKTYTEWITEIHLAAKFFCWTRSQQLWTVLVAHSSWHKLFQWAPDLSALSWSTRWFKRKNFSFFPWEVDLVLLFVQELWLTRPLKSQVNCKFQLTFSKSSVRTSWPWT